MKIIFLVVMWLSLGVYYTLNEYMPLGVLCFAVALINAYSIGRKATA
jgi:hypothetical protein